MPEPPRTLDVGAATRFMAGHARLLDRARLDLLLDRGDPARTLAALDGHRNPDGGYGHGIEPDLRAVESQPAGALHAFEVLAELADAGSGPHPQSLALCDWLASVALDGGALPFALPVADPAACAPFWVQADHAAPSLQITAAVVAVAVRVGRHDAAVAAHPWLAAARTWCLARAAEAASEGTPLHALERLFVLWALDAVAGDATDAAAVAALVHQLVEPFGPSGRLHVDGGQPDEAIGVLDVSPRRGVVRAAFDPASTQAALEHLARGQQADGGWEVDFASSSKAAALEWRGYATVRAIGTLLDAGWEPIGS